MLREWGSRNTGKRGQGGAGRDTCEPLRAVKQNRGKIWSRFQGRRPDFQQKRSKNGSWRERTGLPQGRHGNLILSAHLDDSVSLTDPAVFGCNAVGIYLQDTCILGTWAPMVSFSVQVGMCWVASPWGAPKANAQACSLSHLTSK